MPWGSCQRSPAGTSSGQAAGTHHGAPIRAREPEDSRPLLNLSRISFLPELQGFRLYPHIIYIHLHTPASPQQDRCQTHCTSVQCLNHKRKCNLRTILNKDGRRSTGQGLSAACQGLLRALRKTPPEHCRQWHRKGTGRTTAWASLGSTAEWPQLCSRALASRWEG